MEEYHAKKAEIRKRFEDAGEPVPDILGSSKSAQAEVEETMDPTIRAFLAMEKKLGNR